MTTIYIVYTDLTNGDACFVIEKTEYEAALLKAQNGLSAIIDFTAGITTDEASKRRMMILVTSDAPVTQAVRMRAIARAWAVMARRTK